VELVVAEVTMVVQLDHQVEAVQVDLMVLLEV
jgi:hypothetical protein